MWFHFSGSGCSVPHCILLFGEMPFRQDTLLYKHAHTQTFRHTSDGSGRKRCCLWWINSRLAGKRPAKKIKPACVYASVCVCTFIWHWFYVCCTMNCYKGQAVKETFSQWKCHTTISEMLAAISENNLQRDHRYTVTVSLAWALRQKYNRCWFYQ